MRLPLEITFRGLESNEDAKDLIQQKAEKISKVAENLISCRVAVEKKQKHQQSGNPFRVRIDLRLPPGQEIVVDSGEGKEGFLHDNLLTVIREMFEIALRRVKKVVGQQQSAVKVPPQEEISGIVVRLFEDEGYGFIKTLTGREIYFHENSVLNNDFDRMEEGTGVACFETEGEKGPQASTVRLVDKPEVSAPKVEGERAV